MKNTILCLAMFLVCSNSILAQRYFTIVEATSAGWAGGMAQSGSGVRYTIKFRLNTSAKVDFPAIWIGKDDYAVPQVYPMRDMKRQPRAGDTIIVNYNHQNARIQLDPSGNVEKAREVKPAPINYKGAALLSYSVKKRLRYEVIKAFTALPYSNYP